MPIGMTFEVALPGDLDYGCLFVDIAREVVFSETFSSFAESADWRRLEGKERVRLHIVCRRVGDKADNPTVIMHKTVQDS